MRRNRPFLVSLVVVASLAFAFRAIAQDENSTESRFLEEVMLLATVVGSVAALPALIEFMLERRKRKERISLSLDETMVSTLDPRLAGLDDLLESIADLIDRAKFPQAYASLKVGNELLIIGGPLSGKKTLAQVIAKKAQFDRLITIYNPRNADALAKAKSLITRRPSEKVMLMIPGIDLAFEKDDEEITAELDALIETTSGLTNVLVVGTATTLIPDSPLDNVFGIKIVMPGLVQVDTENHNLDQRTRSVLQAVIHFYMQKAEKEGCRLVDLTPEQIEARILASVTNAAEIEDILTVCQTSALYRRRVGQTQNLDITPPILENAISRVIVSTVKA